MHIYVRNILGSAFQRSVVPFHFAYFPIYALLSHFGIIECIYFSLGRLSLCSDLRDENLRHWTTEPNWFEVAALESNPEKVVGMVAYKVVSNDKVDLNRLAVDINARGKPVCILFVAN